MMMTDALASFGDRAIDWLYRHRDDFRVTGEDTVMVVKRLAELALVTTVAAERSRVAAFLRDFAWLELKNGLEIADALPHSPALAVAYLPFRLSGLRSDPLEMRLADPAWRARWRVWPAFVRYGVGVVLESIGVPPPWSQEAAYARLEVFRSEPSQRSEIDAKHPTLRFALHAEVCAHVVLWRTELGRRWAALSPDELYEMRPWVTTSVAELTHHGLLDPLAEVVAAHACVHGSFAADAWRPLLDAQRGDGAIPMRVGERSEAFADLYHSTLAAVLAASVTGAKALSISQSSFPLRVAEHYSD